MIRIEEILDSIQEYRPDTDLDFLRRVYIFAAKSHRGQFRKSGVAYLSHPLHVMDILAHLQMDSATLATGLLHDTVEDVQEATLEEIAELFGDEIASLVDGVTKISKMKFSSQAEKQAENFKKILLATAKDIRVIIVKLADRLHNMRTLQFVSPEQQKRIAQETIDIYAPLANRMGINWLKAELEDLCFKHLQPQEFKNILSNIKQHSRARDKYVNEVIRIIEDLLTKSKISGQVLGRLKNIYSINQKMLTQELDFDQVHDLIAFRIITNAVQECYEVLGIIHSHWTPVPGRFKDYIALPKDNMYQSLHTTVVGPAGARIEIQIRTAEMHELAEEGIAAHWSYKEKREIADGDDVKFAWLRQILEWRTEMDDPQEFLDSVKFDLFPSEVYVFTPHGDVHSFPKGSTPIDFAYRIHSDVGHRCTGARANGAIVPIKYEMRSGDHIEIITSKTGVPSRDWLKIVKTSNAKAKIRSFLRKEEREKSTTLGRSILERELRKYKLSLSKLEKKGRIKEVAEKTGAGDNEDTLYAAIGYGKILPGSLKQYFLPEEQIENAEPEPERPRLLSWGRSRNSGVLIQGVDNIMIRTAKCCNPLPGEDIVGFITRGRGVTVHSVLCPEVQYLDPERRIEVDWDTATSEMKGIAVLQIYSQDTQGLLAEVTKAIASMGGDVKRLHVETTPDKHANQTFEFEISSIKQLRSMIKSLEKIKGVLRVERL